jgi:F-type H+-transporting ATPase subunit b
MHFDATFWVGTAFIVFIGVLIYYKVPGMLTKGLDERAAKIRNDLDEARKLREEAQALLANYERKQRDAMSEAKQMVEHAHEEAKREAGIAAEKLEEALKRREQSALEKIALAEAQAEKEVREAAVAVAIEAATQVIAKHVSGERADALIQDATGNLRRNLN